MTHEFKQIVAIAYSKRHQKHVLATVVALDGSSYRKPGVQMLLSEDGSMTGALSGGCVEKEVLFQAKTVFETDLPKIFSYDGSFRLGCKGILYILLEPFSLTESTYELIQEEFSTRNPILMHSYYEKEFIQNPNFGSLLKLTNSSILTFRTDFVPDQNLSHFSQTLVPIPQLILFGVEHDAVALCKAASLLGWEVLLVASPANPKVLSHFSGAKQLSYLNPEMPFDFTIDSHTAVVLMSHNYSRDLRFLLRLENSKAFYVGILGSAQRREQLLHDVMEHHPEVFLDFMESIYSPAGINIGAVSPQEIAISILSEIIAIRHNKDVPSLRHQQGSIHQ